MLLGQAVMINWSDVAPEHRPAYYEWHSREHMVGRVGIPGFRRGRRYIAASARRDFLVMYEVDDLSVLTGAAYLARANAPSALTQRTTPFVKNSVRGLARVTATFGIGTGGWALTLRFDPAGDSDDELARYLTQEALPRAVERTDIVGAHLLVADQTASTVVPVEREGRPTDIPNWIILIEGVSLDAVNEVGAVQLAESALREHGCAPGSERETYGLQIMVSRK